MTEQLNKTEEAITDNYFSDMDDSDEKETIIDDQKETIEEESTEKEGTVEQDIFDNLLKEATTKYSNKDTVETVTDKQTDKEKPRGVSKDLLDKEGNVLALAGKERRVYERNTKLEKELDSIKILNTQYETKLKGYEEHIKATNDTNSIASQHTPQEQQIAYELLTQFKQDPVKTINTLIADVKAKGMNIDGIGQGVDTKAVKDMIANELKPFTEQHEMGVKQREQQETGKREYNAFIAKYPDAVEHVDELVYILDRAPQMTPTEAFFNLREHYRTNNLEWNSSTKLTPAARPSGRYEGNNLQKQDASPFAPLETSYKSIIKDAMVQANRK